MGSFKISQKERKSLRKFNFPTKIISVLLILFGAVLLFAASFNSIANSSIPEKYSSHSLSEVKAEEIYIPALERTLNISDGYIDNGRWTISKTGVSHLTTSALPGEKGNVVLYGHNREGVLGKLWKVQKGDIVYIVLSNGSTEKYKIFERKEVKPNEIQILDDIGDSRLTIYTCSGFLDSARFVVVGMLVN